MRSIRPLVLAALACAAFAAAAQQALEIIALRHATVEQVIPTLRPLLEPGATLSGQQGQLFVRTSPANLAEIRQALAAIDRPARRLQILVRFDDAAEAARQEIGASGRISNRGSDIEVRAQDSRSTQQERVDQRLQVLEGGRAFISSGQSRPMVQRRIQGPGGQVIGQDVFVQEANTGFEVAPRISGERVFLDILPQKESFDRQGNVQGQRLATSVVGRLGEWFEIGGVAGAASRDDRGIASASRARSSESRRIWVKVEEMRN
jgi:type II secretory pathway component HofQ